MQMAPSRMNTRQNGPRHVNDVFYVRYLKMPVTGATLSVEIHSAHVGLENSLALNKRAELGWSFGVRFPNVYHHVER